MTYGTASVKRIALGAIAVVAVLHLTGNDALFSQAYAQDEEINCPEGDGWLECRAAAGDRMAVYRLGRIAYEKARETGDFADALNKGRALVEKKDKNGTRLLKMTHLQLSWGGHKDLVQAYVWLVEDRLKGIDYLDPLIRNLSDKMTPEQLAEAKASSGTDN